MNVSSKQKLSENFIREFRNDVDWSGISFNQVLSEAFIIEFQDRVNWVGISSNQVITIGLIEKFKHLLDMNWVSYRHCIVGSNKIKSK